MSVARCQAEVDSAEFIEWLAYQQLSGPFDGERGDYHAAAIAYTVAQSQSTKKLNFKDYLYKWDKPEVVQSTTSMRQQLALAAKGFAKAAKRGPKSKRGLPVST